MLGIVLWYNAEKSVGMVWCEDQGPLAFVGPDVELPEDCERLDRGCQIFMECREDSGMRTVCSIESVTFLPGMLDATEALANFDIDDDPRPNLRVVA